MINNNNKIDCSNIWHPFTQKKLAPMNIKIVRGQDVFLIDENGNKYIDLISSWWVNLHGHGTKEIADAIFEQSLQLEHVMFAGFTHDPAINLVSALSTHLPNTLSKFFFSDNGSTAVEIAIKIAYQYYMNIGDNERTIFMSFKGGYHGDTFGAMSVGCESGYHTVYKKLFFNCQCFAFPARVIEEDFHLKKEIESLQEIESFLDLHSKNVVGFIMEPLIQGAAGMRMCTVNFLNKVLELCKKYEVLVIFDEVMTGFYRTGKMFAMDHLKHKPDIMCISKGLTGGFLPLALTITTEQIYSAFYSDDANKALLHGHTYTANPISCAAANASLNILFKNQTLANINCIQSFIHNAFQDLTKYSAIINEIRFFGTIGAFAFKNSNHTNIFIKNMFKRGILLRSIANIIYWIPPYCISQQQMSHCFNVMCEEISTFY